MSIEFRTAFTESPVVEFKYPVEDLQSLFNDCDTWEPNLDQAGLEYKDLAKRITRSSDKVSSQGWKDFGSAMEQSKNDLVEHFLKIDTQRRWPNIPQQIAKQIIIYKSLVNDLPGYKMDPHIDNRSVYAAGYLNIVDNDPVTVISTRQQSVFGLKKAAEYHAPGTQGTGVLWLNTENSWHWVNTVSRARKIILISVQIVPWD